MITLKKDIETKFTAYFFIASALMLWIGWFLSPHNIGEYIVSSDFESIGENIWFWIWMFRIHIFGWVTMAIAIFALVSITAQKPNRAILVPGAGMTIVGTFTIAIAMAFYYNFGAWGVGETSGKSPEEIALFMESILYTKQYVTCFVRFGRIFSGVGLVLLGYGFIKWKILPSWLSWFTVLLGLVAMLVILFIPEYYEHYKPLFHVKAAWLMIMGIVIITSGINQDS
jgi:magnesium-transporting ATPase (P-type)